jgi:hypothetical protein
MYKIVTVIKKSDSSIPWISATETSLFTEDQIKNECASFIADTNIPGILGKKIEVISDNEMRLTTIIDSLDTFNKLEEIIAEHPFTLIKNKLMVEKDIFYLAKRTITEVKV